MFESTESLIAGGAVAVALYLLVSNTLWLLFGSRLLQTLPGVNINGFRGTLKIAAMLVFTLLGILIWAAKLCAAVILFRKTKPDVRNEIRGAIRFGATRLGRLDKNGDS